MRLVDSLNTSALLLPGFPAELFEPALKFVKYHDIRICDFSDMVLQDTNMQFIADYLAKSPNLRSLILDGNEISDDGLARIAMSLKKNNKLAHLSIKNCELISD